MAAEYGQVIRIDSRNMVPWTHELIEDTAPLHVLQFCRTMTLAQGRILYDVWDDFGDWRLPQHRGYLVPNWIVLQARKITTRDRSEDWRVMDPIKLKRYDEAWHAVVKSWPGIPVFGARRVVERLLRLRLGCGKQEVDEAVVRYAMRNFTSYWVRVKAAGVSERDSIAFSRVEEEVREAVAERLRVVLESWMKVDVPLSRVEAFFEQKGLLDIARPSYSQQRRYT